MTAVAILPHNAVPGPARYQAVSGRRRAEGASIGTALDALTAQMESTEATGVVVVQTMEADAHFPEQYRQRLQELMEDWRARREAGEPATSAELEHLVEMELEGTIGRTRAIAE